jgi:hypothetical protein
MKRETLTVEPEIKEKIKEISMVEGKTMKEITTELIMKAINEEKKKKGTDEIERIDRIENICNDLSSRMGFLEHKISKINEKNKEL